MFGKTIMEFQPELDHKLLDTLGLDAQKITSHQKKIQQVLLGQYSSTLPVVDVCSLENQCIIADTKVSNILQNINNIEFFKNFSFDEQMQSILSSVVTCIPAAGAASRYWQGASNDLKNSKKDFPKALLEATAEKDTFLQIKVLEHEYLFKTQKNVFIAPKGFREIFKQHLVHAYEKFHFSKTDDTEYLILEQNENLSTIRFNLDGSPYFTNHNQYSCVPAGHGELLHLFVEITKAYPQSRAVHLRNIDNIIGTSTDRKLELNNLAHMYALLQKIFDYLRDIVSQCVQNPTKRNDIIDRNILFNSVFQFLVDLSPKHVIIEHLKQLRFAAEIDLSLLLSQLNKPLSVLAVVKKEDDDQGGGPVYARLPNGNTVQICLEMSHVSDTDKEIFFGKNGKLKYFNPAVVFFETRNAFGFETNFKQLFDESFWLLSKRKFDDQDVCYHETVLYELIGNSEKTNLFFIEVPRSLFKPHKYFKDSEGKSRKEYGI